MKKKGFTLSELLVVVVIIGVLSAVVLPKFSKVIETRKTTEAEELMSAVRTEQEARCTLSKSYTASKDSLGSYKDGKYFNYALGTVGMSASATSGKYKLEMPSYADGRICCSEVTEGSKECEKLNKNYPTCEELKGYSDYKVPENGCEIETEPTPNPEPPVINACPADHPMVPAYTDEEGCTVTTSWELKDHPTCWVPTETKSNCPIQCDPNTKPESSQACNTCGTQTRTVSCDTSTGTWDKGEWSSCSKTQDECSPKTECTDGETRKRTPAEDCWDGCGEVYDACASNGTWTGACLPKSTSECGLPGQDSTKKICHTTAGVTTCRDFVCHQCKWVDATPKYEWRSAGIETTQAKCSYQENTAYSGSASECLSALNYATGIGNATDLGTCLAYAAAPFASDLKCANTTCNADMAGQFCIAGCHIYKKVYGLVTIAGQKTEELLIDDRTGYVRGGSHSVTKTTYSVDWTMSKCENVTLTY